MNSVGITHPVLTGALSTSVSGYLSALGGLVTQFTQWGQWLFCGLLVINMMWFWVWLAFEKGEFDQAVVQFLKKFLTTMIFYTLMIKHDWLMSVLQTAQFMGQTLTHSPSDPSSIVSDGIALANVVLEPVKSFNLFNITFGAIIILVVYLVIVFVFMSIALRLAATLIETTALISVSSFFLGFAALSATSKIAHNMLESIIASCAKLIGLYVVIGAGMHVILNIAALLPQQEGSFDDYWWLLTSVLLFWSLSKSLPDHLARIVGFTLSNDSHLDTAALAMSTIPYSKVGRNVTAGAMHVSETAGNLAQSLIKSRK
jgi:P-type conjugative transfer protein TrbL